MSAPRYWEAAQEKELAIWEITADSGVKVLWELAEVGKLCLFGQQHGLDGGESVIELGVGPLGIGWGALMQAPHPVVVDPLPRITIRTDDPKIDEMATEMQRRSTYVQADATQRLGYPDASFDLIVCDNVVDHTQEPGAILLEAYRLAKPGGRLLFGVNVFSLLGIAKWRYVYRQLHPTDPNVICHPHSFLERHVLGLLADTGWDVQVWSGGSGIAQVAGKAYLTRAIAIKRADAR